jgi:ATP-dependent DNA helicase DinG
MQEFIRETFSPAGPIAAAHPGYEGRPEQVEMALEVARCLNTSENLLVEAGTGVGKSFAYLIPVLRYCLDRRARAMVSTQTKTLQAQLVRKDLPFLKEALGWDFRFEVAMGVSNYLCLRRLDLARQSELFERKTDSEELSYVREWAKETETGLFEELPFVLSPRVREEVGKQSDLCLGTECPYVEECFYRASRKRQFKADLIVVNHHLYFANLAEGGRVLPPYDLTVFDEAHNLESVSTSHFGVSIGERTIRYLLSRIYNPVTGRGKIPVLLRRKRGKRSILNRLSEEVNEVAEGARSVFSALRTLFGEVATMRLRFPDPVENTISYPMDVLADHLARLSAKFEDEDRLEVLALASRCKAVSKAMIRVLDMEDEGAVYWFEGRDNPSLNAAPIDVSSFMQEKVFGSEQPAVLTSATLTVAGSFEFVRDRLGVLDARELLLDSPFDFKRQAVFYLSRGLSDPRDEARYVEEVAGEVRDILRITGGHAFVLFTSYRMLDAVHAILRDGLPEITLFRQGEMPRDALLSEFKLDKASTLLGTNTFWEGVDVPGEALRAVIIARLPFDVPDDPVFEARSERVQERGGDSFWEFSLPQAVIRLRQGFGRLIRNTTDTGLVAILDPRVLKKAYGTVFLRSLPECTPARDLGELKEMYEALR